MSYELIILGWTLVLAFIQILAFDVARTAQYGLDWNTGARDEDMPPLSPVASRLQRAQANLYETLPLFAIAVLITELSGRNGELTFWGALIYLVGRAVYVPLYAAGIKTLRSVVWLISTGGMLAIFVAILTN